MKSVTVGRNEAGQRFDKLLLKLLSNSSKGFIYKMLRKKNITLNDSKASGNEILNEGDIVKIWLSDETYYKFAGEIHEEYPVTLDRKRIVFEDTDMLLYDKPAGILSQKKDNKDVSIVEMLTGYLIETGFLTLEDLSTFRPSVVNRLDRNTSGLIVCGKTLKGLQNLSEEIRLHNMKKDYIAIVEGRLETFRHLENKISKNSAENKISFNQDGDTIITDVKPIYYEDGKTLVMVRIYTGKTHQIRMHLSSIGYPITGDGKYGNGGRRQLLHSYRLGFPSGQQFETEIPEDFKKQMKGFPWELGKLEDFEDLPLRI